MILVDSSVILDIFTEDPKWFGPSAAKLAALGVKMPLAINAIIWSEVSAPLASPEDAEQRLSAYKVLPLPVAAAFWAAKAFLRYRKAGGNKVRPLPDFFIGAHAYVAGLPLLTRDPARVKRYFPSVELVAP